MRSAFMLMLIAAAISFAVLTWAVEQCELTGIPPNYCFGER